MIMSKVKILRKTISKEDSSNWHDEKSCLVLVSGNPKTLQNILMVNK